MIIKPKLLPIPFLNLCFAVMNWFIKMRFNKLVIRDVPFRSGHSYLLMCNHFSFWDGFWAIYLCWKTIRKTQKFNRIYIMVLKKQMEMNPWLKYFGCFSVSPGRATVSESLAYAAELLNTPGNVVLMYPQGNLESNHVRDIVMNDGIAHIVSQTKGPCQLLWSSNLIEYFEGFRASVYFHMLDCGSRDNFNFLELSWKINAHHREAVKKQFRFTEEGI